MDRYLYDEEFLKQLNYDRKKEVYVKIIALSNDNVVEEEIEGKVTNGSVNVDGASAVRRTCFLSLIALEGDTIITDQYWSYDHLFKLRIGLKNNISKKYPDIVWFDMGIYVITNFNSTKSTSGLNISISGKDKMCRLNGEVSGNIMYGTDFGTIDEVVTEEESGEEVVNKTKLPIKEIIKNAVQFYGQESKYNIIINDLDDYGYEPSEYQGDTPMYVFVKKSNGQVLTITFDNDVQVTSYIGTQSLSDFSGQFYSFNTLDKDYNNLATEITSPFTDCYIAKIEADQVAGYHQISLVYNDELILNSGETVTSLLDRLKAMLGEFEYFYDLEGRFVFQKKKNYLQELFSPINGEIVTPTMLTSKYSYKFEDEELFTSIGDTPNINNVKNDFAVWGNRKSISGTSLPIHVRYAIDKKPSKYISPYGEYDEDTRTWTPKEYSTADWDWRELLYQMALDYYAHNQDEDFAVKLQSNNPKAGFKDGKTGYETYYPDLQAYWRELYNPLETDSDREIQEITGYEYYDGELSQKELRYWNKLIHYDPSQLNFWFDFLDTEGELSHYSVKKIGTRSKVVNDSAINSIYNEETPEVLLVLPGEDPSEIDPLDFVQATKIQLQDNMEELFYRSAQRISAIDKINELLNTNTVATESLTISAIPIYYLEPNTRIYIKDHGDFVLDKISYSLGYNGTMNLNCTKVVPLLY